MEDRHLFGSIIFVMSFFGACANWMVSLLALRIPSLRNAFGRLNCSQATAEAVLLTVFVVFCSPMIFFGLSEWEPLSKQAGYINLIAYDVCCWSHLFIAINRFCAIFFPFDHNRWFSDRNTRVLICASWFIPMIVVTFLFKLQDCHLYVNINMFAFDFTHSEKCKVIAHYIDFYKDIFMVATIFIFDVLTVAKVRLTNNAAILQGIIFLMELLNYFVFAPMVTNKYLLFMLTSFTWISLHSLDGLIILTFNKGFFSELRGALKKCGGTIKIVSSSPATAQFQAGIVPIGAE